MKGNKERTYQMELQQVNPFSFMILITSLIFIIFLWKLLIKNSKSSLLPPGPSRLPIIGHLHHLLGLPHHSLRDLANKHGPLMHLQLGELSNILISSPAVAKQMMKTHDLAFSDRPQTLAAEILTYGSSDIATAPYGDMWRQLRKVCILELLSAKRVQSFWSVREEEVLNLIANISSLMADGSLPINLSVMLLTLSNDITARVSFGKKCNDKQVFISLLKEVGRLALNFAIPGLFPSWKFLGAVMRIKPKIENVHHKIDKILEQIIREHVENRMSVEETGEGMEEDLVDVLLRIQGSGELGFPITRENVKAVIFNMFIGGTDTTATLIEWAFSELLRNPRVMRKAQAEVRRIFNGKERIQQAHVDQLSYLQLVINETLRLHPPGPLLVRECREGCQIEGYEIQKGTRVIVNAWALGRDPENWRDPDKFEPERFQDMSINDYKGTNFAYLPFGAGRRICPGILFAMANVELPLAMLLYHFDWQMPNQVKPEQLDMTEVFSSVLKRKNDLFLVPTPYNP